MPRPVVTALALAAHPNGLEAHFRVAADRGRVRDCGIDLEASMSVRVDEVAEQCPKGVRTDAASVDGGRQVDVDVREPVVGLLLGRPLDPSDGLVVLDNHEGMTSLLGEVFLDRREEIGSSAPVLEDFGRLPDLHQGWDIAAGGSPQPYERTGESNIVRCRRWLASGLIHAGERNSLRQSGVYRL
jgi:hypothetical protein